MKSKILLIKSSYTSFDSFINQLIQDTGCCDICTNLFSEKINFIYLFSLLKNIISIKKCNYEHIVIIEELKIAKLLKIIINKKINVFFFNTIDYSLDYINRIKQDFKLWTFDKNDAKKFDICLTQQFFFKNIGLNYNHKQSNDVYFIGEDKGRYNQLCNIVDFFNDNCITHHFIVVKDKNVTYIKDPNEILTDQFIPYENVIEGVLNSKAILEIVKKNQVGLTYRTMEALFLDKKLITNNIAIKNEFFYDPKKIFIISDNNYDGLVNFIKSKDISYSAKIKEYYSFENWIKNFTRQ